jgi:hypothetical protein
MMRLDYLHRCRDSLVQTDLLDVTSRGALVEYRRAARAVRARRRGFGTEDNRVQAEADVVAT